MKKKNTNKKSKESKNKDLKSQLNSKYQEIYKNLKVAVITISDRVFNKLMEDENYLLIKSLLKEYNIEISYYSVVPDEMDMIENELRKCVGLGHDLVLTNGGTGFGPRDVTPEATKKVIIKETPGISELMRYNGFINTPKAALSRAVSGIAEKTLIINLPGTPKGVKESLEAVLSIIPHAYDMINQLSAKH